MSGTNKFVLTTGLLTFIMISAVACRIHAQMVKERVYNLKQPVIDTALAVTNIAEYRRNVAIDLINTLNPAEEQLLIGLHTVYADSASPSYLYDVGPYLISNDECAQVKKFEKNCCTDIMQVVKYRHVENIGFISFDDKTFVYYLYPVTHDRSLIFLLGLECSSLLSKSLAIDGENLMFSLSRNDKPVTGDEYNAENTVFTVSEAIEHFAYLPTRLYIFVYKKDVCLRVCTLIILFTALVAMMPGTSCLYLVRRMIDCGIMEKEVIINNRFEYVLDGGLFFSATDVKKLCSMYNLVFLDDPTKVIGRKSLDEDLKALPERDGYLCLFDADKFKNINDTFGYLLGDGVLMKAIKILKSQVPADEGKIYRFSGDEFVVIYTGGTLEELLSILKGIVHFQVGGINLGTSIGVAHSNECITVERLRIPADGRLRKSKESGRVQISWQQSLFAGRTNDFTWPELIRPSYPTNHTHRRVRLSRAGHHPA